MLRRRRNLGLPAASVVRVRVAVTLGAFGALGGVATSVTAPRPRR